jgi:hypothetical protein
METLSDTYKKITLHIGAHRTGSSSLQAALHIAESELARTGLDIIAPQVAGFRKVSDHRQALSRFLTAYYNNKRKRFLGNILSASKLRKRTSYYLACAPRHNTELLWSEENILGKAISLDTPGILYPDALENLRGLKSIAGESVSRVIMSIRSYPEFLISYEIMQQAYGGGGIGLNQLQSWAGRNFQGWTHLARALPEIFDDASIEIWLFSSFNISNLFEKLTYRKLSHGSEAELKGVVNASATKEALSTLREKKLSSGLDKSDVDQILYEHKDGQKFRVDEAFSDEFLSFLFRTYESDSQEILRIINEHKELEKPENVIARLKLQ